MAKVAILTNFMEFNPGYSLTSIVKDQAKMLVRYGHEVHLFVNEQYHGETFSEEVTLHKSIPFAHLIDYRSRNDLTPEHKNTVKATAEMIRKELQGFDFAFTHDFVFTGWFMPYGMGIKEGSQYVPHVRWLHWIHSVPTTMFDWWCIKEYGSKHKLVFPNETDKLRVAEQFRGSLSDVRVIPHIKDLRTWFDFGEDTCAFIDDYPGVIQDDVVVIYPASTDRLHAKGIRELILILSKIKSYGLSVTCVIANQWATGRVPKQNIEFYKNLASQVGLVYDKDFTFTSEWGIKNKDRWNYENGLPRKMLRELMQCSNLFIFPTREESFGLVAPEIGLAGGVLVVLNQSLSMMLEVSNFTTLYFNFGSFHQAFQPRDEEKYYSDVASIIVGRMRRNESIMYKTFVRKRYNFDTIYRLYYEPIFAESKLW